jgi:hypothetical protein|tara:strand:+ start:689 stop:931 length:243 start_codon:yes stop_codon:yes gene_type:complete
MHYVELMFIPDAEWIWTLALMAALFFPVRKLIWVLSVRREINKSESKVIDKIEKKRLLVRASITAGLLSLLFSIIYNFKL